MRKRYTKKEKGILVNAVLKLMESGKSCGASCRAVNVPATTFHDWRRASEDLTAQYARARESMIDVMAQEILDISDEKPERVDSRIDTGHIQDKRLRVDTRKWLLSKVAPKQYGDRIQVAGDEDAPLAITEITRTIVKPK